MARRPGCERSAARTDDLVAPVHFLSIGLDDRLDAVGVGEFTRRHANVVARE